MQCSQCKEESEIFCCSHHYCGTHFNQHFKRRLKHNPKQTTITLEPAEFNMLEKELFQRINLLNLSKLQIISTTKTILDLQNSVLNKINELIMNYKYLLHIEQFKNSEYSKIVEIITSRIIVKDFEDQGLIKKAKKIYCEDIFKFEVDLEKHKFFKEIRSLQCNDEDSSGSLLPNYLMIIVNELQNKILSFSEIKPRNKQVGDEDENDFNTDRIGSEIQKSILDSLLIPNQENTDSKIIFQDILLNLSNIINLQSLLRGYIYRKKLDQNIPQSPSSLKPNPSIPIQTPQIIRSELQELPIPTIPDYSTSITNPIKSKLDPFIYNEASQPGLQLLGPVRMENEAIYTGEWNTNKLRCGKGVQEWTDGTYYEGYWDNDKANGKGRLIHANGNVYEGDWKDDNKHGRGVFIYADGAKYEGTWEYDKKHGKGIEVWSNGAKYYGDYFNGQKNGRGIYTYANGDVFNGEFQENNVHGYGTLFYNDGRKFIGLWKESKMHGKGIFYYPDGKYYEGGFIDNKREGFGIFLWPDGRKYSGLWLDGKQHGPGTFMSPCGAIKEGIWKEGKLIKNIKDSQINSL